MQENYDDDQHIEERYVPDVVFEEAKKRVMNRYGKVMRDLAAVENLEKNYPNIEVPYIESGFGWMPIVEILFAYADEWNATAENEEEKIIFDQIKEKFGGLRVYYTGGSPEFRGMVEMAEIMSKYICERCGDIADAERTKGYWCQSLCSNCKNRDKTEADHLNDLFRRTDGE